MWELGVLLFGLAALATLVNDVLVNIYNARQNSRQRREYENAKKASEKAPHRVDGSTDNDEEVPF